MNKKFKNRFSPNLKDGEQIEDGEFKVWWRDQDEVARWGWAWIRWWANRRWRVQSGDQDKVEEQDGD